MSAKLIAVLNGPNLNLLGSREREHYGVVTLGEIEERCKARARDLGFEIDFRQTNSEAELVGWIQEFGQAAGIVINAAAYTHTSIAIHDALKAADAPAIEVHLSNIAAREHFRHRSYVSPVASGTIFGLGALGYELAIEAVAAIVNS
ncbi:MAG: type II 3-dehydroquinate dehydratase [Rhizobiales bacterium]|nr:type II 3-dehydroquinate dehydratase [Hyphomicrobiales bacterium]